MITKNSAPLSHTNANKTRVRFKEHAVNNERVKSMRGLFKFQSLGILLGKDSVKAYEWQHCKKKINQEKCFTELLSLILLFWVLNISYLIRIEYL